MLGWAVIFFIIALAAGVMGFTGISVATAQIAQLLFFLFLILFVISLVVSLVRGRAPPLV